MGGIKQLKSSSVSPAPRRVSGEFRRGLSIELDSININPPHPAPPTSLTLLPRRRPFFSPHYLIPEAPASSPSFFFSPRGHYHTFDGALPLPTFSSIHYHRTHISILFSPFITPHPLTYPPPAPSKYLCPSQQLGMFI